MHVRNTQETCVCEWAPVYERARGVTAYFTYFTSSALSKHDGNSLC